MEEEKINRDSRRDEEERAFYFCATASELGANRPAFIRRTQGRRRKKRRRKKEGASAERVDLGPKIDWLFAPRENE